MPQAVRHGRRPLTRDALRDMIFVQYQRGQEVDVREHLFLVATGAVTYDWFQSNIWFTTKEGDEQETHYPLGMLLDRFQAPQYPGLLLLHAAGNVFVRKLEPGQTILVKPTAFLFKDTSVKMQLHIER